MAFFKTKFNSLKQEWTTPAGLFEKLNDEFHFETDLAADATNFKCPKYFTIKTDGLKQTWEGSCWLNPPYGSKAYKLENWIKKAFIESQKDSCTVVMLIPARTNTNWWHKYCMKAAEVRFICGRPKFGNATHGLPQPLAIIIFKKHTGETIFKTFHLHVSKDNDVFK